MAIRVEFYAQDQVTASSIVEFALSCGAVLQSYSEIDAPLAKPATKPAIKAEELVSGAGDPVRTVRVKGRHGGKRARMDYDTTMVSVANHSNPSQIGSKSWKMVDIILANFQPMSLRDMQNLVHKKMKGEVPATTRSILRSLIKSEHLEIVS